MSTLAAPEYQLARLAVERGLGFLYLVAFLVALRQFPALCGERGLEPAPRILRGTKFWHAPSLFHLGYSDARLRAVAWVGMIAATLIVLGIPQRGPLPITMLTWFVLWGLYLSIQNVGGTFYSFGWETLLLETGFLAIFLGPTWTAPPLTLIWLLRWLLFRVEFGAGLIKIRGDACWRDLTCLYYHHETQPMPGPLSWYFHHLPKPLHRAEVLGNHFAQLVVPFFLFFPQPIATVAGLVILVTQSWLLLSGNFSWLNVVTMTLAIASLDDAALGWVLPIARPALAAEPWHQWIVIGVTIVVVLLSYRPARNLMSRHQLMNTSFDPLHLVNTYGAFGSITKERYEIVIEGTDEVVLTPSTAWREYEFKAKPGDVRRRPPQYAPYHLRLDWLMWFAAMSSPMYHQWFVPFVVKLLEADPPTLRLVRSDPFAGARPRFVRATLYLYRFTTPRERRETHAWWVRSRVDEYLQPVSLRAERAA